MAPHNKYHSNPSIRMHHVLPYCVNNVCYCLSACKIMHFPSAFHSTCHGDLVKVYSHSFCSDTITLYYIPYSVYCYACFPKFQFSLSISTSTNMKVKSTIKINLYQKCDIILCEDRRCSALGYNFYLNPIFSTYTNIIHHQQ